MFASLRSRYEGIFVFAGIAAGVAGPAFLVGLLIAGGVAVCSALSSAQLAAAYPTAGGAYDWACRLISPPAGFAAGWMFLASKITAAGTVALGLAGYLDALVPGLRPRPVAAIVVFTALNYFGVRRSSRANLAIVGVSLAALLVFMIAGVGSIRVENLTPFSPAGWRGTAEAAAILFVAYAGYARVVTLSEEVHDPIPLAILLATVVAVGGLTAMLGVILSQLLGLSRMSFAMACRGDLPRALQRVDPRYGVPGRAVLVVGIIAAVVAAPVSPCSPSGSCSVTWPIVAGTDD